jgi:hypothetical protein
VVLVLVFAGWSWVSWHVRAARMELRLVCGPGSELRPRTVLRCACVLLDAVLVCRLLPFAAAAAFGPARWPAWTLAADALAYAACAAVVLAPPSRPCGADARQLAPEVAEAHAKYGHALALETAAARESLLRAACDSMLAPFAPVTFWCADAAGVQRRARRRGAPETGEGRRVAHLKQRPCPGTSSWPTTRRASPRRSATRT